MCVCGVFRSVERASKTRRPPMCALGMCHLCPACQPVPPPLVEIYRGSNHIRGRNAEQYHPLSKSLRRPCLVRSADRKMPSPRHSSIYPPLLIPRARAPAGPPPPPSVRVVRLWYMVAWHRLRSMPRKKANQGSSIILSSSLHYALRTCVRAHRVEPVKVTERLGCASPFFPVYFLFATATLTGTVRRKVREARAGLRPGAITHLQRTTLGRRRRREG